MRRRLIWGKVRGFLRSVPAKMSGMQAAWISVGWEIPRRIRFFVRLVLKPSSSNELEALIVVLCRQVERCELVERW